MKSQLARRLSSRERCLESPRAGFAVVSMNRDMLPYQYVIKAQ